MRSTCGWFVWFRSLIVQKLKVVEVVSALKTSKITHPKISRIRAFKFHLAFAGKVGSDLLVIMN